MTTAESIERVLNDSEEYLRRKGQKLSHVGNRPRCPLFVLWDETFPDTAFSGSSGVSARFSNIWPQASRHIVHYYYRSQGGELPRFLSFPDRQETEPSAVRAALSTEQQSRNVFSEMGQWRIYNVVNTAALRSVEEFAQSYEAVDGFRKVLDDSEKSMLLALLDESRDGRALSTEIRAFLSEHSSPGRSLYASTVILSNITRNNQGWSVGELCRIAADIVLLSNNDTFAEDSAFFRSVSALYNQDTFVVSYQRLERPNRDIALQIHQTILDQAVEASSRPLPQDEREWNGFLTDHAHSGQSDRNRICEETARSWPIRVEGDLFEHLPLRSALPEGDLSAQPFARLRRASFGGVVEYLAAQYSEGHIAGSEQPETAARRADTMAERWKETALRRRPLWMYRNLTDETISAMTGELGAGHAPEDEPLNRYFEECVRVEIRKRVLYPRLKRALEELRDQSVQAEQLLHRIRDDFRLQIPPRGFAYLGPEYRDAALDFLSSGAGQSCLRRICSADGGISGVLQSMSDCFHKLVEQRPVLFSLSFMDEWMQRLKYQEERIYRSISEELTGMEDSLFYLRGNYPVSDKKLRVFLLHTADMDGSNPTALYESLKKTFLEDPVPQYLNTGYDGDMEAFTFVVCEGLDLI